MSRRKRQRVSADRHIAAEDVVLPATVLKFLQDGGVCIEKLRKSVAACANGEQRRFVRVSLRRPVDLGAVEEQLGYSLESVEWLPGMWAVDGRARLAACDAYQGGYVYGLDAASAAAAVVLGAQPGERILDLCCAPGAKLCYIAELMGDRGTIIGIDSAENRLRVCKSILSKYGLQSPELHHADGRTWDGREFDRVLVDAECTHDGSVKHLAKHLVSGRSQVLEEQTFSPERLASIAALQLALLENGARAVRKGGTLVYATCSLTTTQNEQVVARFLGSDRGARFSVLSLRDSVASLWPCRDGGVPGSIRFDPDEFGGLFVVALRRAEYSDEGVGKEDKIHPDKEESTATDRS